METIRIPRPDDWHVHFRDGALLRKVVNQTALIYRRALVMPNTNRLDAMPEFWPKKSGDVYQYMVSRLRTMFDSGTKSGVLTARHVNVYRHMIMRELGEGCRFEPLMTVKITPNTTPEIIREAKEAGAIAGKLYPDGVTTGSEGGVRNFQALNPVFAAMSEVGMMLCLHGEMPGVFCLDREEQFLRVLADIKHQHPRLSIVLEHITTAAAVETVKLLPGVAATITVHHLYLTLDDVIGDLLQPHNFCKPVAKRHEDREALVAAATSGDRKFFLGTDSAPHLKKAKECAMGCAGVYVPGPVAIPLLVKLFLREGAIHKLSSFTSYNGARHYGLAPTTEEDSIEIVPHQWTVPRSIDGVVPFMAGQQLNWWVPETCWNLTRRY